MLQVRMILLDELNHDDTDDNVIWIAGPTEAALEKFAATLKREEIKGYKPPHSRLIQGLIGTIKDEAEAVSIGCDYLVSANGDGFRIISPETVL